MREEFEQTLSGQTNTLRTVAQRPRRKSGPTIRDVAAACGLSVMSVSAVLNNRQGEVSVSSREKILDAMARLNYHPNAAARALSRKRTETIGIVFGIIGAVDALSNPYAAGILRGALQAAKQRGYDVNIITRDWVSRSVSAPAFNDHRVDGILLIAPTKNSDIVEGLQSLGRPIVAISGDTDTCEVSSVDVDDYQVARLAVTHLLELGHRRIAHITGDQDLVSTERRLIGYRSTLGQSGVNMPPEYIAHAAYNGVGTEQCVNRLLSLPSSPTAIFCGNDSIAFQTMSAIKGLGLTVPDELSIVGVDDVAASAVVSPALTTVSQPVDEIGFRAADRLIDAIECESPKIFRHEIQPQLIIRGSTALCTKS